MTAGKAQATEKPERKHGVMREKLLNAGLTLFSEKGFDGVAIKDIETCVGLTAGSGSFYRHFKSKEALLEAIVEREVDRIRSMRGLQHAVGGSLGDRRAELLLQYRLTLIGLEQIKSLINLLAREYGRFPEVMQQLHDLLVDESLALSARDFEEDQKKSTVRGKDPEALAAVVQSALVGYHLSRTYFNNEPSQVNAERFVQTLVDLLISDQAPIRRK